MSRRRDGQLKQISVNHFRELIGHILNLITQNRPSFQTEATRDDHDSLKNAQLGDAIVNDYLIDKKLEKRFKRAVEHAMVLQMGFIFCPWDWQTGDLVASDVNPITGQQVPIRAGDFKFYSPSIYDVVWDFNNDDWDNLNWVMVRTWENKHDLAMHIEDPEQRQEVLGLKSRDTENDDTVNPGTREMMFFDIETEYSDLIPVWHFFHRDTDACSRDSNEVTRLHFSSLKMRSANSLVLRSREISSMSFTVSLSGSLKAATCSRVYFRKALMYSILLNSLLKGRGLTMRPAFF